MEGLRGGGKERFERNEKQKSTGPTGMTSHLIKGADITGELTKHV